MLTAKTADGRYGLLRRAALLKAMKKGAAKAPRADSTVIQIAKSASAEQGRTTARATPNLGWVSSAFTGRL